MTIQVKYRFRSRSVSAFICIKNKMTMIAAQPRQRRIENIVNNITEMEAMAIPMVNSLYHLEQVELQIIRLGNIPKDGMVGGLLAAFDLTQGDLRILCRIVHHLTEIGVAHKM